MKRAFMSNIKNFVDSNVRQRIDRVSNNNNQIFSDDLLLVERQFDDLRQLALEAEKRISNSLQSLGSASSSAASTLTTLASQPNVQRDFHLISSKEVSAAIKDTGETLSRDMNRMSVKATAKSLNETQNTKEFNDDMKKHKKLPIVAFLKFLIKTRNKLRQDTLLATTFSHCSHLQSQLTSLLLSHEQTIETKCLKPLQHILEVEAPNVIKLKKSFIKSHNDLESARAKYNGASLKQLNQQSQIGHSSGSSYTITRSGSHQATANKIDQLKTELEEAQTRFEQAKDAYATEMYAFVCRELELVNLFVSYYQYQAEYQQQVSNIIQNSIPSLSKTLVDMPRKMVFGAPLEEHLRCTGNRCLSLVIELCVHILYAQGLEEEGLFRIPGSAVKVKRLKNAINAWFISLANQSDLDVVGYHQQPSAVAQQQSDFKICNPSLIVVYDMFKDILGHRPQTSLSGSMASDIVTVITYHQSKNLRDDPAATITTTSTTSTTPTSVSSSHSSVTGGAGGQQTSSHHHQQKQQTGERGHVMFDVNSIACLLKLYLRELPEPLFTFSLYNEIVEASVDCSTNGRFETLEKALAKLPKANLANLRHLIRFLHLLTCHHERNKMTATNLAIAMAPSLIWATNSQTDQQQCMDIPGSIPTTEMQVTDPAQALSMQMTNIGMSASLHALVIENLISNAERLLPGQVNFTIPGLIDDDLSLSTLRASNDPSSDRFHKSSSPTVLSTASSSSFSSNSTASHLSTSDKTHSRKSGSMDGLLNDTIRAAEPSASSRPASVNITQSPVVKPPPPPAPPTVPARPVPPNSKKHPPPPVPQVDRNPAKPDLAPKPQPRGPLTRSGPVSLRGSGSIPATASQLTSSGSIRGSAARPTVPPPERPGVSEQQPSKNMRPNVDGAESDAKSSHSSCKFEEMGLSELDNGPHISPVVSLDSVSGEGDADASSFDEEFSLENSWSDESNTAADDDGDQMSKSGTIKMMQPPPKESAVASATSHDNTKSSPAQLVPTKPPRSSSPKAAQSTPL